MLSKSMNQNAIQPVDLTFLDDTLLIVRHFSRVLMSYINGFRSDLSELFEEPSDHTGKTLPVVGHPIVGNLDPMCD